MAGAGAQGLQRRGRAGLIVLGRPLGADPRRDHQEVLAAEGCLYVADWTNDDQPYFMDAGSKRIVSIPYSYDINDSPFFYYRNGTIDEFEKMIRRQFDVLYEEGERSGRVMAICLHPFIIGVPHRIRGLDSALAYIASHEKVWFATGEEIVRHWLGSGATF